MTVSRRTFLAGAATSALARPLSLSSMTAQVPDATERFDPWLEIDRAALRYNVSVVSRLSGGRPIMAVIKNNAYGLGLATVAAVLEELPEIMGFAVVKTDAAITLRDAGIRKPVLLMGLFSGRRRSGACGSRRRSHPWDRRLRRAGGLEPLGGPAVRLASTSISIPG